MKTEAVVAQSWDDLVFENRNKEYGAYSVRRSYSDRVIYALFITLSGMAFALLAPVLTAILRGEEVKIIQPKDILDIVIKPKIYEVIRPEHPVQPAHAVPARSVPRNVIPVVTSAEIPNVPIPDEPVDVNFVEPGELNGSTLVDPSVTNGGSEGNVIGQSSSTTTKPFKWVEIMPEYMGGLNAMTKFIQKKINYPASARRTGMDGTVYVSFVVDPDGNIINPEVMKGISADCDAEALRLISMMPRWKPGQQNHTPVSVKMVLPIRFKIEIL